MSKFAELINSKKPVLVDFFANWCGPCKAMDPVLSELKSEMGEKARIVKVDVDANKHAAFTYGISGVPTFVLFKNGKVIWKQSGATPKHQLSNIINQFV